MKVTNPKNIENKWDHAYWDKNDDFDDIKSTYSTLYAKSLKSKKELKFKDPFIMDWDIKIMQWKIE